MSILISNRGNTTGMNPLLENSIEYVQKALDAGFHVVVDTWLIGDKHLSLGAELPKSPVDCSFLKDNNIICRAVNIETLEFLLNNSVHCFINGKDDHILTNGGLIWTAPGKKITPRCIVTMPEWTLPEITMINSVPCAGICSDRIQEIKDTRKD